jgi:mono/diheme cytochrome c family protein
MRTCALLSLFLVMAGCDERKDEPVPGVREITFDGAVTKDAAGAVRHGERISWVLGCHGCHGKDLQGLEWDNDPKGYGLLWTSNLTRAVPAMSDADLETLLRHGKHPTRPEMWAMPSELFQHLSSTDMSALIAYLRTIRPAGDPTPLPVLGPKAIAEIKSGEIKPADQMVKDAEYRLPPELGVAVERGRRIVAMTCAECHGGQLGGGQDTPDLVAAAAYSRAEFETLMTTGVASGGRKLKNELMSTVAQSRFAKMTIEERDAVYAYLVARADRPRASP